MSWRVCRGGSVASDGLHQTFMGRKGLALSSSPATQNTRAHFHLTDNLCPPAATMWAPLQILVPS